MWEYLLQLLHLLPAGIGYTTLVGVLLAVVARFVPNSKLQDLGYKFGLAVTVFGSAKMGKAWEKVEEFCINSFGQLLTGFKNGLQSDDGGEKPSQKVDNTPDVRV
jgi:hypothetical protein